MRNFRHLVPVACLLLAGTLFPAGCTKPKTGAPGSTPVAVANPTETAAASPETVEKVGPSLEAAGPAAPAPPVESTEKLPEVVPVNTQKLGGLVEKTLGKVTVLNIWATWCGPCIFEIPDIVTFYNEMDPATTAFISLSLDEAEDITTAIPKFQREHKVPFPIYVLNERNDEGLRKALRGPFGGGIPATFIYDQQGRIVEQLNGAIALDEIRAIVDPLRKGTAQPN